MRVARAAWLMMALLRAAPVGAGEIPLADFARHEKFHDAAISPDGKYLAVTGIIGDRRMLSLVRLADMKTVSIKPRDREDIDRFWWVAPDRVMYTVAVHFGSILNPRGTGELFTVDAEGEKSQIIFGLRMGNESGGPGGGVSEHATGELVAPLRDDPRHAVIASYAWQGRGTRDDIFPSAFRIDLVNGHKAPIGSAPIAGATFVADHAGVVRFASGDAQPGSSRQKVFYRKESGGSWEVVAGENDAGADFVPLMFDRSGTKVYAHCPGNENIGGICRWDTQSRKLEVLWSAKESSQARLVETFDGLDAFAVRTMSGGRPATVLLDKSAPEAALLVSLLKQFPGVDVEMTSAATDGSKVVLLAQGDDDPGVFYLYQADTKKVSKLLDRRPWIKPQQMAQMEPVALKARDGLGLNGYLTRPVGKEKANGLPLVVFVHGGPYGVWDGWTFDPTVQALASRGYAVLQVNFRGSGGYGSAFLRAGFRDWGGKMQDDVTDATRWAIADGVADPQRICIFGASYGGYAALEGAVREPDLYRCAIGYVGIYDLRKWVGDNDFARTRSGGGYIEEGIGTDAAELWERSPLAHVDRIKAKVMLIVGGADQRVPKEQGETMRAALEKAHNEPDWLYERTEGHGFYDEDHVAALYERVMAFLDRNIGTKAAAH